MNRSRVSGQFKFSDREIKRRTRRAPAAVAAAVERQKQIRADIEESMARHFPALAKKSEVAK